MEKDQKNEKKAVAGSNWAETIFRRDLKMSRSSEERIKKTIKCFELYAQDINELNQCELEEADESLLGLVGVLKEEILTAKLEDRDRPWNLSECLSRVYDILPVQHVTKFLFPKTKKELLRTILSQLMINEHNTTSRNIFKIIWGIYSLESPYEERNIIDSLFKDRLRNTKPSDVEKWMVWIQSTMKRPDVGNEFKFINEGLAHLFVTARARESSFDDVMRDIRNREIVDMLGVKNVSDDLLPALGDVCAEQIELCQSITHCLEQIAKNLSFSDKEKISFELYKKNTVRISIIKRNPEQNNLATKRKYYAEFADLFLKEMKLISDLRPGEKGSFVQGRVISLELLICDENAVEMFEKEWYAENIDVNV